MSLFLNYITVLLLSIFLTGIFIPQILLIAFRKKIFDDPDPRKIHQGAVPRLGGLAFTPVICFGMAFIIAIDCLTDREDIINSFVAQILPLSFGLCALLTTYVIGIADDLIGVRYRAKFLLQILIAIFLIAGGLGVTDIQGLVWVHQIPFWVGWILTIFFIIFVLNAMNLIDGIDGLASGLSAVAILLYGAVFALRGEIFDAILSFAALGVLIPFYYYNVFGKAEERTKIFMGDTGSLTIALIIVFLGLRMVTCPLNIDPDACYRIPNLMLIVLSPLMVPCMDVVRVYIKRVREHRNPFLPDKTHIHHKLLDCGMKQRSAMMTIVLFSFGLCCMNLYLSRWINMNIILLFDVLIYYWWNIIISKKIKKTKMSA